MRFKPSCLTFLILLVINSAILSAQQSYTDISPTIKTSIFKESFDNNSNNWVLDNSWIKGKVENSQYLIICKNFQKATGLSYIPTPVDQSRDYEIEASLKNIKGTGGLIFGITEKYDHYRVELAENKLFVAWNKIETGRNSVLASVKLTQPINLGIYYKITVRKYRGEFFIFLNEKFMGRFDMIKPETNTVGFNVGINSEIAIDYLNVSNITEKEIPKVSEKKIPLIETTVQRQSAENTSNTGEITIIWTSPSGVETTLDSYSHTLKAKIESPTGLSKVSFYVNGLSQGEAQILASPTEKGIFEVEKLINFSPGKNTVYIMATNENGFKKSDDRYFTNPNSTAPLIRWSAPVSGKISNNERITIEACIKSEIGLRSVNLLVNGISMGEDYVFQNSSSSDCSFRWSKTVVLRNGKNSIYIIAQNNAGNTQSDNLIIDYQPGSTEKRIALVMGNADYKDKTPLKNPVNDANLMAGNLESLGFKVIKCTNAGKVEMEKALGEFCQVLPDYNVALFYYAGHGIQVDGSNYLIPIDAKLETKAACKWQAIELSKVVSEFEKFPDNINIVILDACRNDPFTDWVRGSDAGFRFITNVSGTIIGYATVEGATAADGNGANGLYTEELIKQMNIPQPIESVFKKTRVQVEQRSNGTQSPRESSGLRGEFYFKKE